MTAALVGLLSVGVYTVAALGIRLARTASPSLRRLQDSGRVSARPSLVAHARAAVGRRFGPSVYRLFNSARRAQIEHRLDAAGRPDRLTVMRVAELKAADVATALVVGLVVLALTGVALVVPVLLLYGWLRSDLIHQRLARRRQAIIERDLPDFLDVLAITIQAGLKFRGALRRVCDQFESPLSEEIRTTLQQMDIGAARRAAFTALRDRNDSPSLNRFVSALLQAEELGAPLTDAMGSISTDMRKSFAQRARRQASEAAPKVSLVATVLLLPGAVVLLVGGLLVGADLDFSAFTGLGG